MTVTSFLMDSRAIALRVQRSSALQDAAHLLANQAIAIVLIVLFAPIMIAVALVVWRHDGSPIVFRHYRVGQHGRLFACLKFRSMAIDSEARLADLLYKDAKARADWERDQKLEDDPRITPIGRLLRRTSLDELPQLFNVLRGEMVLVGPRPITVEELRRYGRMRWHYLAVRPGVTGLWQVSGRSSLSYDQRVDLDRRYVERRSLLGDAGILLKTLKVVLLRDGAR